MIRHHPDDSLLMALAAGSIALGPSVVVAAHVERCRHCLGKFREFEAIGGVLLAQLEPAELPPHSLERTLVRINQTEAGKPMSSSLQTSHRGRLLAELPPDIFWPRSLVDCSTKPWRRLGPGVRWSRVTLSSGKSNLHLFRVAAGKRLPVHGHRGGELSQVLCGSYTDGDQRFDVGDFVQATDSDHHQPIVTTEGECICLISVEGHIAFDGPLVRVLGALLGI